MKARTFELPSISSSESVGVVRFLMRIPSPDERIVESIESAVQWLESAKILNTRIERFDIPPVRFEFHTATQDLRVVIDPKAKPIWARYYEIETNRPFFCNRGWGKVYSLAELDLERRTGSGWHGRYAEKLLKEEYPRRVSERKREP